MSSTMPERAYLDAPYGCEDDYDSGVWCVKKDRLCNTEYVRTDCAQDYPAYKREKKIRCGLEKQLATANAEIERLRAKVDASNSVLASVTDRMNSWCRECGVQEARGYLTLEVRDVLDALWARNAEYRVERDKARAALEK